MAAQNDGVTEPDADELDPLTAAVVEAELQVMDEGDGDRWGQPPRLFALADLGELLRVEPQLRPFFADRSSRALIPLDQGILSEEALEEVLGRITWPGRVRGCVLVMEIAVLPASARSQAPDDLEEAERWSAGHPERRTARLAVGVRRDGRHVSCLRIRGESDLLVNAEPADDLVAALLGTF